VQSEEMSLSMNIIFSKLTLLKCLWILITLSIFLNPFTLGAQEYLSFVRSGDDYYQRFDNLKALSEYEKAYKYAPDNYEALMKLTRAYNDVGEDINSKESETYYEKAVQYAELLQKQFPYRAEAYFYLSASYGNLALFRGGKEKIRLSRYVESNAKKAIELAPDYDLPYIVMGVYYREVANLNWFLKVFAKSFLGGLPDGTIEDSERMLLIAVELNPKSIYAHYQLGITYEAMGKKDKAVKYYKKVIELPNTDHQDKTKKTEAKEKLRELLRCRQTEYNIQ